MTERLTDAQLAELFALFTDPPSCPGAWTSGSGGHRRHVGDCKAEAVWRSPNDSFAYCQQHCPASDKDFYMRDMSNAARALVEEVRELRMAYNVLDADCAALREDIAKLRAAAFSKALQDP